MQQDFLSGQPSVHLHMIKVENVLKRGYLVFEGTVPVLLFIRHWLVKALTE